MKASVIIALLLTLMGIFPLSVLNAQSPEMAVSSITDIVVEYTSGGKVVQIGDITMVIQGNIVIDNGSGEFLPAGIENLKLGQLVKADLAKKTANSYVSTQLTIYADAGIANALKEMDPEKNAMLKGKMEKFAVKNDDKQPLEQVEKTTLQTDPGPAPRLVNGVWTN